ncbi:CshA/CshB family fibrillar adhesin-related protein, partial [Streptococcus infantis]|uniref:CshA/CshB family fibrillar adhesin-related protein n=1 Tax=Streptococcus infantis TaxID=68892 RepID=UPI001CBDEA70
MKNDLFNDRISRFSIRKLHVGVCSVLLGTLVMIGTATNVSADEAVEDKKVEGVAATTEVESPASLPTIETEKTPKTTYQADAAPVVPTEETGTTTYQAEALVTASEAAPTTTANVEKKADTVAAENTAKHRTRRALGDANDPNLIADDVEDATSTPKVEKPTGFSDINAKELVKQINWLDFGDTAAWTNTTKSKDGRTALQVGSTYTKEIMPGYVVNIKVKSLKPFQATEIYKKRMEDQGATEAEKATYDPNAKNGYIGTIRDSTTKAAFANREEALVVADAQNGWTEIRKEGIDTGSKRTTITPDYNGGNIGVQFEISATFRGKVVKPAVVAADGESANPGEIVTFTTNGTGWQYVGEWKKGNLPTLNYVVQDTHNYFDPANNYGRSKFVDVNGTKISGLNLELLRDANEVGPDKKPVAWKYFGSPDQVTGGLGTGVFGPNVSASKFSVPLVMTRGASEVGLYIASSGKQSAMIGFFPLDEGDAPESYGKAQHSIGTVDGVTGAKLAQPYLGSVSPDMDEHNALDWEGDDKATSGDEGVDQILPDDLKGATNEMIKLDRTRPGNYTLKVEAHTGGADKAYLYGWIDFNQNGKFDDNERSDLATITQDGTVELKFNNGKAITDPTVTELGVRVRIAKEAKEIESPTGLALSGEVEDFKTQVTFPPKGERKETQDIQGVKQTATVAFTPQGLSKYSRSEKAVIDEKVAPVMIDNKTKQIVTPDADGYYAVAGQGKYKITANGKDVDVEFIPEDNFVGTADGISIRRTDNNGATTDWNSKDKTALPSINEVMDNMDGLYIPTVTPKNLEGINKTSSDVQGATQTGTPEFELEGTNSNGEKVKVAPEFDYPAKFVSPTTGMVINDPVLTVEGEGIYYLDELTGKVTFVPEPGFTGTAKGVTVSLTAPVGRDKDGRIPTDALKTATAKYTPTVTPITVTPTDKISEDIQNVPQTQTPTFDLSNDKTAKITSKKLVDPATGQPTDETTVTVAGEGTYTIDPTTGAVTFTPEEDFVGTAKGVKVQATATITNENGKKSTITADAAYTPTVVAAEPTANPATSIDVQGATQTGTPTFAGTTVQVNGEDKEITIKDNSYTLLDDDGNQVTTTPAYAEDGVTAIGTFSIDSATGTVTFTPTDKSYTGKVTPVTVVAESSNGIVVGTTYTPEIVPVKPTATPAETTDIQGATQTGKPEFKGGTVKVNGVEKTVPINETVPATFEDGSTTKTVEGVGTYTVAPDGTVTFVPEKSFVGKAPAVTVVREDKNGTKASATYTPTVTPVKPTATPAETTDIQGATQTGKPEFTAGDSRVPINEDVPATFDDGSTTKTIEGVGTYTVAADGTVTFVPEKSFVGTAPAVTVVREDKNGTKASATYTPTVTPVEPTATPAETTDIQGATQTGKPEFTAGDSRVPINEDVPATFDDGSTTKTVEGVGTYTVVADGTVTFVPEKSFVGTAPAVTVVREDKNGTKASATYTPTVTPVKPTATPAETTDIQGATQTGKPKFTEGDSRVPMNDDVPATFDDGTTTKTVDGIGTYTVAADGTVTFVPEPSFTGTAPAVTVVREDKNGTKASATYTPTVTPVTPTAKPVETIDIQGATQTGKPEFTEGDSRVPMNDDVPATFDDGSTTKTVDGVGTYTVAADGTVTFVPEKSFTGTAPAVTVVREDKNGTKASATYTPTVTPVTPTAEPTTSTGKQGQTQTGKPEFTEGDSRVPMNDDVPATFDDGSTTKTVDGVGTYTVAADGTVTFVPEKSFTGTAPAVTVVREDKNGTKASATYTPTVTPVTPTATPAESTGPQGLVQTGTVTFTEGDEVVPINKDSITLLDESGQPAASVDAKSPAGDVIGTYTVDKDTGVVTFTPTDKSYSGEVVPVKVQAADANGTTVETTYTPKITPVVPTSKDATSTDIQGQTQSGKPTFTEGDPNVPMDDDTPATFEDGSTTKTIPGEGTYTVAPDGTVTFVPEKSFTGTGTGVTVKRVDKNGTKASATYTPTVTTVTPTATPVETTGKQGQTQTGKPEFTEGDSRVPMNDDVPATFDDGSTTKTVDGVGTYTVAADGTVTFVPEPSFTGTASAVTVVREDKNGTKASATYTPTVTPVTPTAEDTTSTDKQGQTQTDTPTFTPGNPNVPMDDDTPATFEDGSTTKTIPGEGTYTVAPDGTVTFVPEKSFTGEGTGVSVKRADKNGTPVTAKYTPTVTPVTPTATPAESTGPQGLVQTGTVIFTEGDSVAPIDKDTITLLDENGQPAASVDAKSPAGDVIGTFTVDKETGIVTFTPTDKSYSGDVVPVKVQGKDTNGTVAETTYTPTITPVVPTADPATSTDIQGQTQTGTPSFTPGNPAIPMDDDVPATFEDGSTTKVIPGEGTYTVAPNGTVTFVPEKSFTGEGTGVTVKRVDKNGTPVTATYTPTVTPVTPTAEPTTSTGKQGQTQTGKPEFTEGDSRVPMNDDVPATFEDGLTTKTVDGEGTYTVSPDGTVTFVPEKSFTGTGTGVTVKRVDKNGTPVTAKYTPTVTPVTPTATPATTIGSKGQEQSGKPAFKEGDSRVPMNDNVPATFEDGSTTKTIPGVGTYTVAADGTVTFKPEPEFTGTAPSVTVVREDVNGTKASATYTPTVTPVTTFVDKAGNSIPGYPREDGEQPKKEIPGYRFVETKKLPNGDTEHVYEPVTTSFKDKEGNDIPGYPSENGEQPKKEIPGYRFVETKKLPNGDTEHVYEQVKTSFKDKEGNSIPGYPSEDGEQPKKAIPGYRFVETKKLPNGDTEHVYEPVTTSFKDKEGNSIPGYPSEDGEQPKKEIPGYRFVETKKLPNGDTEHVYEPVKTSFKDKEGNSIPRYPSEDGEQPKKEIPGYRFVETKKLPNGDTEHVYEPVKTSFKDKEGNDIPGNPSEDGEQLKKEIPGYRFVETKKLPNGDIEHVYEQVKTSFKDKEGNDIPGNPSEDGEQLKKEIPGYRFVETKKLPNGDIEHVYEQVKTSFKDKEGNDIPGNPSEDG